jgi:hypothetical protein
MPLSLAIILRFAYSLSYLQNRIINNNLIFGLVRHLCPCTYSYAALYSPSRVFVLTNCLFYPEQKKAPAALVLRNYAPIVNDHDGHARLSRHCRIYFG